MLCLAEALYVLWCLTYLYLDVFAPPCYSNQAPWKNEFISGKKA